MIVHISGETVHRGRASRLPPADLPTASAAGSANGVAAMMKSGMRSLISSVAIALSVFGGAAISAQEFQGKTLRVQTWGGTDGEGIRKNIIDPFVKMTGTHVVTEEGITSAGIAKVLAQRNDPQLDVLLFDDVGVDALSPEGLLERLDLSKLSNSKNIPKRFVIGDAQGISWGVYVVTIIYNSEKVTDPPRSWKDLWDPKYKGKILLPKVSGSQTLFLTLMTAKLNGGGLDNLEPAWGDVEKLVNNAHSWIENRAIAAELMRTGEALIAVDVTNLYKDFVDRGYPLKFAYDLKEGVFPYTAAVAMVKGSKADREVAYSFINRVLSAEAQEGLARMIWYAPTNTDAKLSERDQQFILHTPEQWAKAVEFDRPKLVALRASIIDKWNALVSRR